MGVPRQAHHIFHSALEKVKGDYVIKDGAMVHTLGLATVRWKF